MAAVYLQQLLLSQRGANTKMEIIIKEIRKDLAIEFIQKYHYSNILPKLTKYYLGYFENEILIGIVTLGWGTQPLGTIRNIFKNHSLTTKDYLEIGKMCFLPNKNNSNYGSKMISILVKWLKQKDILFLYTLADGIMGKCGYVYQASNFVYIGSFETQVYMDRLTKEKIHPRSAKKLIRENEKLANKKLCWLTSDFCEFKEIDKITGIMFRYVYPLNKKAKKIFDTYAEYKNKKNPKNADLKFKKRVANGKTINIEMPSFDMNANFHNSQKPELSQMKLFQEVL